VRRAGQLNLFTKRVAARLPPSPEFHLHCMVADVLRRWADPEWRFTHIASGELRTPATAARLKRMGAMPGYPDFILLSPGGVAHFLELKRARGAKLSEDQQDFADWCVAHGVPFAIARNFDEALCRLQAWGAVPNKIKVSA
jgi:hypothetical protein